MTWDEKKKKKENRDRNGECDGLAESIISACIAF